MAPCSSCLRPDQMVPDPDLNRIISYDPVTKRDISPGWKKIGNEGSDLHSHVYELRRIKVGWKGVEEALH